MVVLHLAEDEAKQNGWALICEVWLNSRGPLPWWRVSPEEGQSGASQVWGPEQGSFLSES